MKTMNAASTKCYTLMHKLDEGGLPVYAYWEVEPPPPTVPVKIISPEFQSEKEAQEWWEKQKPLQF